MFCFFFQKSDTLLQVLPRPRNKNEIRKEKVYSFAFERFENEF
jgi:hypothetical protein